MLKKFIVLIITALAYYCLRNNNIRSEYKIKIPRKYINLFFPLLDKRWNTKVDIILFLDAAFLVTSCVIYYVVIIFELIQFEIATVIWIGLSVGTTLVMGGVDIIRRSCKDNIVIIILERIFGGFLILLGIFIIIATILGRYDLLLIY